MTFRFNRLKNLPQNALASFRVLLDARVPFQQKLMFLALGLGYVAWPWDFVFDVPFVGQIDDVAVFLLVYYWFMSRIPEDIRREHGWKGND